MLRVLQWMIIGLLLACALGSAHARVLRAPEVHPPKQETGFLNRVVMLHGISYRFQIYLPESFQRDDRKPWPVILFLHGRGERGSEGMWQTQIGLPQAVRDHPERWPFVIVMPQCPLPNFWTDPEMLDMAMHALDQETDEFHLDRERNYLVGLSMGGYGAWELARLYPHRWAAAAIAASGIFWSYAPERWEQVSTLPAEYAHSIGGLPVWLFQGSEDNVVIPRQSDLMFNAVKAANGHVRLWVYEGLHHDCWTRAFNEPELPRWLLAHHGAAPSDPESPAFAERLLIPLHPSAIQLDDTQLDALAGEYRDATNHTAAIFVRQGDQFYERNPQGDLTEINAESPYKFFYPYGSSLSWLQFEHDSEGRITAVLFHDDRHEERWERHVVVATR